jgi:hypothetical protein
MDLLQIVINYFFRACLILAGLFLFISDILVPNLLYNNEYFSIDTSRTILKVGGVILVLLGIYRIIIYTIKLKQNYYEIEDEEDEKE